MQKKRGNFNQSRAKKRLKGWILLSWGPIGDWTRNIP